MLISNHSPFVKVWVIIQLIAKHLNWWMWIGYVKFNMFHLKISHWIFEDSLWFSSRIRSFSGSFVVFETSWEQKPACILTWPVQRTESCSIIPQLPRFLSVQTQWAIEKTCQQEVQSLWDVDELMGFWSMNILSYYRISHVYPIPYTHISLFEFNQILFSPSKCDAGSPDFFQYKSQQRLRGVFLHSCPMFFSARNGFLTEQIDMSQERMQLSELSPQLVNQILARRLGAWRLPPDHFLLRPI